MKSKKTISGFSKLSKIDKIKWIVKHFFTEPDVVMHELKSYWLADDEQQRVLDGFSENTISNYYMPYGVAPNFVINGQTYCVPMVIEESSVVAAASAAAKFWMDKGGFKAEVIDTQKVGQVHFSWNGDFQKLKSVFEELENALREETTHITANMQKRGGGILNIELIDYTAAEEDYYQLKATFETCDSMGANFINSVLEQFGRTLTSFVATHSVFNDSERDLTVIMAILSNYTPDCLVRVWVECPIEKLGNFPEGMDAKTFAEKFCKAVQIAQIDPYRATTHNKGIFNGIDSLVLATANDFRAIEACGHTYAARDGQYRSLSNCSVENGRFKFWMDLPLAVGTVGGLTKLHPIAKRSLELLGNPSAKELMGIIAVVGLAQNFSALRSLITTGIQKGHMKMHLLNILNHLNATDAQVEKVVTHFEDKLVSFTAVREYLATISTSEKMTIS
ncbi:hydroxymethylglutaryl-CoA reductase, degradative [Saprospiraceae bacterium]|jgi:hydroxymethylglutaryl-CoA reductase|nr:hydroxymethylglutaryl-CoA reductase, degradative [Bacteroidota bacterium]MDB4727698.1 hydroxymethylglutaryl-CoA reductase, degradative [Saprospiraceae bacterium]MDF1867650.1 hydroxymethylglutaryl-CoA reductase, degradative [Saprospiraceae bacterium]